MSDASTSTHGTSPSDLNVDLTERADLRRYLEMIGRDYVPMARPDTTANVAPTTGEEPEIGQDHLVLLYVIAGMFGLFAALGVWLGGGSATIMVAAFVSPVAALILHQFCTCPKCSAPSPRGTDQR